MISKNTFAKDSGFNIDNKLKVVEELANKTVFDKNSEFSFNEKIGLFTANINFNTGLDLAKAKALSDGVNCKIDGRKLKVDVVSSGGKCIIKEGKKTLAKYVFNYRNSSSFNVELSKTCKDQNLQVRSGEDNKPWSAKTGYVFVHCLKTSSGTKLGVYYSPNYKLKSSLLRETSGKNKNYKIFDLVGFGDLANASDLIVNRFQLVDLNSEDKQSVEIFKRAFLSVRQSPFEVEMGMGLGSSSISGNGGSTSSLSVKGLISAHYQFWKSMFTRVNGEADILELSSSSSGSGTEASSNFYYSSQFFVGYRSRFGGDWLLDSSVGLDFSKFSYTLGTQRRIFNRRGFSLDALGRKLIRERTKYWVRFNYSSFPAEIANSGLKLSGGWRWGETKFTIWGMFQSVSLGDNTTTSGQLDTATMISTGLLLDF